MARKAIIYTVVKPDGTVTEINRGTVNKIVSEALSNGTVVTIDGTTFTKKEAN